MVHGAIVGNGLGVVVQEDMAGLAETIVRFWHIGCLGNFSMGPFPWEWLFAIGVIPPLVFGLIIFLSAHIMTTLKTRYQRNECPVELPDGMSRYLKKMYC